MPVVVPLDCVALTSFGSCEGSRFGTQSGGALSVLLSPSVRFAMPNNMAGASSQMSEIPSLISERMRQVAYTADAVRAEMQQRVSDIAALASDQGRKSALNYAARILKLPPGRIKALFYGEARRIDAHEADQIRAYYEAAQELIEARKDYETKRRDFLRTHPIMAVLVPPALEDTALSNEARCAALSDKE